VSYDFTADSKHRVIVNTDAKNEADDQFAIVHALLTPAFEIHGIIPAHFGDAKSATSMQDSHDETMLLLELLNMPDSVQVCDGAAHAMPDKQSPVPSDGARLIIEEAMRDDPRPLNILFYGPLTDMASALLIEPEIENRDLNVIWIGGGPWPDGGDEYNLSNDIHSANVVFESQLPLSQIPSSVYRRVPVSYAELYEKVYSHGPLGKYLVDQLVEFNLGNPNRPMAMEFRSLGDSPAVAVTIYPDCGVWSWQSAPEIEPDMTYVHNKYKGRNRPIRVYEDIDSRFILEDFFAKLKAHVSSGS